MGDAALAVGLSSADVDACLLRSARRPGMAPARRVAAFLDGLSESPGESLSRVALQTARITPPTLQYEVRDGLGTWWAAPTSPGWSGGPSADLTGESRTADC